MAARGRGLVSLYICLENLNDPSVRNHWTDFNTTLQECFFGNRLPRLFKPSWFIKKCGCQGAGLIFPMYLNRKLKKSSCQKPLDRFHYNLTEMFPCWPSTKIFQVIMIHEKKWPPRGGAYFSLYIYIEMFKNFLVRNQWTDFNITRQECFFGNPLPRLFKLAWFVKNMAARGRGIFSLYIYKKKLKIFS